MIYLDYAASSPVLSEAAEQVMRFMTEEYANPSSIHQAAQKSRMVIDSARREIAGMLNCRPEELIFTSGGTESDNLAIFGAANGGVRHIITSAIEHEAVLQAAKAWRCGDRTLTILKPDSEGGIHPEQVEQAILELLEADRTMQPGAANAENRILVSVMTANNELGTIEPICGIGEICEKYGALFHTDAVQAFGHIPIDVKACHIDLLSASGHKLGAPKGVGFLYASSKAALKPQIYGGGQERKKRSGTLNTPGIAGLYEAVKYAEAHMAESAERISRLRNLFLRKILSALPDVRINGPQCLKDLEESTEPDRTGCLPGHLNLSFPGIEAESLLILLDMKGIAASAGSACASGALEPSHVLRALPGMDIERANASLRFSFGEFSTEEESEDAAEAVIEAVRRLRALRYGG